MKTCQKGFVSPLLLALIAVLLVGGGAYAYMQNKQASQPAVTDSTATATSTTDTASWQTYTNTQYGYTLNYPEDVLLQPVAEEERLPVTESGSIVMGLGGTSGVRVGIYAWVSVPVGINTVDNPNYEINKGTIENNQIIKLDLRSFSKALRQRVVDDKNSSLPNKNIGELEEIIFAGRTAYAVTVSGYSGGYGFSTGDPFKYIYLDDGNHKFVLQYSLKGGLSKQIIETFKFTQATTTAQEEVTVTTYIGKFMANTILVIPEYINGVPTDVQWTVNYKDAKYFEERIEINGQINTRPGDFDDWLKTRKQAWDPSYHGPGIPGVIKITGIVSGDGTLIASKITQHVQ